MLPLIAKKILGFERYTINTIGEIYGPDNKLKIVHKHHKDKYLYVKLRKNGKRFYKAIHRLMAITFLGLKRQGLEVRHLDGNRYNNKLENLSYGTREENLLDDIKHGKILKRV